MANEPVYVTFEFRGNLEEEVNKVTLGIRGMRDESAKTYQRLIADSSTAFNAMSEGNRKLAVSVQENINALRDLAVVQKSLDAELEAGNITVQAHAQATASLAIQETNLRNTITQGIQTLNARMQQEREASDSVNSLIRKLRELTETYNNLSKADREGTVGKGVLSEIQTLDKEIGTAQTRLSQYSRSAGTGFNSLNMSVQQVARELPSLTMGANMFFLAISNNLPILADNLKAARVEYDLMKQSRQTAVPVWKQVVSSIISWQTALVVGITLLSVYGKDIINWTKSLFGAQTALKSVSEIQNDVNKKFIENTETIGKQIASIKELQSKWNALGSDVNKQKKFIDDNKSAFDAMGISITNVKDAENLFVKNTESFIEALKLRAQASAAMTLAGEQYAKQIAAEAKVTEKRKEAEEQRKSSGTPIAAYVQDTRYGTVKSAQQIKNDLAEGIEAQAKALDKEAEAARKTADAYFNLKVAKEKEAESTLKKANINSKDNISGVKDKEYWESVKKQADSVLSQIDSEQKKLLDSGKTAGIEPAIVTAYRNAKSEIDKATEALKVYDSYDKQDKEKNTLAQKLQKRLDSVQKLTEKEKQIEYENLQFALDMEQKHIDLKDESYLKRSEQSDLNYKKELLSVQRFADEKLKMLQEAERLEWEKGGKQGLFTPSQELPSDILGQVEAMKAAALTAYKKTNSTIVADMDADFREERVRFQGELQKKLNDIEQNYKERLKAATGNEALIAELEKNKQTEIQQATEQHTMQLLNFYADLTKQKIALANKFHLFETDKRNEQLLVEKKAVEDSLKIMKKQFAEAPTEEREMQIASLELQLAGFNKELEEMPVNRLREALGMLKAIFNELGNLDGEIGEIFSGMAGQVDNILTAFDNTASATDKISAGLNGLVSVINMVTSASQKRKEVEKEFYKNAIAMAHEYALALNEQLRLQSELSGNGFVTDYVGQIKDGFNALTDAQQKYDEAIKKLSEGKAKVSLRNSVDWGNVGKGAAGGAAAGAAIGSVIPVIGTAIGAVVGAIGGFFAGLFGGKKKKETFGGLLEVFPELVDSSGKLNKELAQSIINTDQVDDNTKQLIQNAIDWADAVEEANKQIKEIVTDLAGDLGNDLKTAIVDAWKAGEDASKKMFSAASKSLV